MTYPIRTAKPVAGQPVTRVDGPLKVTGKAPYAADHPIPNLLYAVLVCSTVARGAVERIDSGAARKHRDVLRVLTDFAGVKLPFDPRQVAFSSRFPRPRVINSLERAGGESDLVAWAERRTSGPALADNNTR